MLGMLKRDFLGYSRGREEIEMMRAVKAMLDPNGMIALDPDANDEPHLVISLTISASNLVRASKMEVCL